MSPAPWLSVFVLPLLLLLSPIAAVSLPPTSRAVNETGTSTSTSVCEEKYAGGPFYIDLTCTDPDWYPIIDEQTDVTDPHALHIVSGHYHDTDVRFNIYFPPKEVWQGRFFQYVYPLAGVQNETVIPAALTVGVESGAFTVQTRGSLGYRHEAASAKLGRHFAADYYGVDPSEIKGYAYGGSGGSEEMAGMMENTNGIWNGGVIFVQALPSSIPNAIAANAFGALVLENKTASIADALLWGGNGNAFDNLTTLERLVLDEVTGLGTPEREWEVVTYNAYANSLSTFWPTVQAIDPTYADDFWSLEGYLGTEQSELGDFFRTHRHIGNFSVTSLESNSTGYLTSLRVAPLSSNVNLLGSVFGLIGGSGQILCNLTGSLNSTTSNFTVTTATGNCTTSGDSADIDGLLLTYDNSFFLATHVYYRHNIPTRPDFYVYNQFKLGGVENGTVLYPQRPIEIGPIIASSPAGGGNFTGNISAPVITVSNLLDPGASAWNADWYGRQIRRNYPDSYGNMHRIWYTDNAEHENGPIASASQGRVIQYDGILYQALRDMSAWVEEGVPPPDSSNYWIENGQVQLPFNGTERGGVQPSVHLCIGGPGVKRVEVPVGQTLNMTGHVDVPAGTGCVVRAEWDFEGNGNYSEQVRIDSPASTMQFTTSHTYDKPGTYYPVLRVASTRDCQTSSEQNVVAYNLDRNRAIVRA
ncbi:hypothetical protein I316_07490 [Kwoniella heveanensis BCC8398]|uniref:PKD domain-containing protein n=1 Tax=Kwoniella heveanensis BCC8398 TaxID=1296120 RepID=A0A1B9GIN6_9TREE|nr:hypothetical protein I316_07490 [Kwoniella heveanensis BCC8398]